MIINGISGDFQKDSVKVTLRDYLTGLSRNRQYTAIIKTKVDESKVTNEDKNVAYSKKLRVNVSGDITDCNVANNANGIYDFYAPFTYSGDNNIIIGFDQLLRGTRINIESIEIVEGHIQPPTEPITTSEKPTIPTSTEENPSASSNTNPSVTTNVSQNETPGQAVIKKINKKKKSAKKIKIKLKKVKNAKGYQIAVYKNKKNAKKNKKAIVKKYTNKLKKTIKSKKLKNKKKIFVRARAFVLDAANKKLFGKWSKIKKVKIKK